MKLKFGTNLPNGAKVILEREGIILAYNNCGNQDEFVTWKWDGKDPKSTYLGHYSHSISLAARDFDERVAKEKERANG